MRPKPPLLEDDRMWARSMCSVADAARIKVVCAAIQDDEAGMSKSNGANSEERV